MDFIIVYITNPTRQEARKIAKHLLEKRLIACANILGPIDSMYLWKGKIESSTEYILIAKTIQRNFKALKKEVEKIHSYTVPCIIKIPASPNQKYLHWVKSEVI